MFLGSQAHLRVKRDESVQSDEAELEKLQQTMSELKKAKLNDEIRIRKLASAVALMALALKGSKATSAEKKTVVAAVEESEVKDQQDKQEAVAQEQPTPSDRSASGVRARASARLRSLVQRAHFEFDQANARRRA